MRMPFKDTDRADPSEKECKRRWDKGLTHELRKTFSLDLMKEKEPEEKSENLEGIREMLNRLFCSFWTRMRYIPHPLCSHTRSCCWFLDKGEFAQKEGGMCDCLPGSSLLHFLISGEDAKARLTGCPLGGNVLSRNVRKSEKHMLLLLRVWESSPAKTITWVAWFLLTSFFSRLRSFFFFPFLCMPQDFWLNGRH